MLTRLPYPDKMYTRNCVKGTVVKDVVTKYLIVYNPHCYIGGLYFKMYAQLALLSSVAHASRSYMIVKYFNCIDEFIGITLSTNTIS